MIKRSALWFPTQELTRHGARGEPGGGAETNAVPWDANRPHPHTRTSKVTLRWGGNHLQLRRFLNSQNKHCRLLSVKRR